jgi:hypothetical protein
MGNPKMLGKIAPVYMWFLTFFDYATCRRVRGDNLLQLGCVGLSTCGKSTIVEAALWQMAHQLLSSTFQSGFSSPAIVALLAAAASVNFAFSFSSLAIVVVLAVATSVNSAFFFSSLAIVAVFTADASTNSALRWGKCCTTFRLGNFLALILKNFLLQHMEV